MDPTMILIGLTVAVLWGISRITSPIKVGAMTRERREKVVRMRRFTEKYARLKAQAGASERAAYGPLTPEQIATYQTTRERLKKAA